MNKKIHILKTDLALKEAQVSGVGRMSMPKATVHTDYRYLSYLQGFFITVLVVANTIGGGKPSIIQFSWPGAPEWNYSLRFGAGIIFFPLSYLIGDLLTEVYGYATSRRIIWTGFAALLLANVMIHTLVALPPAPGWALQKEVELVFAMNWRIALASMVGFAAGEFTNSFIMARMKLLMAGQHLWARTIGSTIIGEAIDSILFYPLAFWGSPSFTLDLIAEVMVVNYLFKVVWEIVATPLTYWLVAKIKRDENLDHYDFNTDFSPFRGM